MDAVPSQPIQRVVAPVVGQQRSGSGVTGSQYSTTVAAQQMESPVSPSQGAGNMGDLAGVPVGSNMAMLIPGTQPMFAVSAVANDVPTLMSQLALAGANIQGSFIAGTVYAGHSVPSSNQCDRH